MKKAILLLVIATLLLGVVSCKDTASNDIQPDKSTNQTIAVNIQSEVHEPDESVSIVVTGNVLLGALKDGKWVDSEESGKLVSGKEKFAFFTMNKVLGSGANARIETFEDGNSIEIERDFKATYSDDSFYKYFIDEIGISGRWNPLPRTPKPQNTNNDTYKEVVKGILAGKGLGESKVDIKRITRVDLDGNGTEEVLITATDYDFYPNTSEGSYSVIILRKIVNGIVENIVLKEQYRKEKPEYEYIFDCPIILDADNDGVMELVIEGRYEAWSKIEFCKIIDNKLNIIYKTEFGA